MASPACKAEAHDGKPGGEAAVVGEPFNQRRYRRDVADAQTNAADKTVKQVQQREAFKMYRQRRAQHARAEEQRAGKAAFARAVFFNVAAQKACG